MMVSDSLVARELEETRRLPGGGTVHAAEQKGVFSPTLAFLHTTPASSVYRQQQQQQQQPHSQSQFQQSQFQQLPSSFSSAHIAPPKEEQDRRGSVRRELDAKMGELATHIGKIENVVSASAGLLDRLETVKLQPTSSNSHAVNSETVVAGQSRCILELEEECFKLLASNATIALQLQQLGLDLQRVYRRFKTLEVGGGGEGGKGGEGRDARGRGG